MSRRRFFGSLLWLALLVNLARVLFAPLLEPVMATFDVGPAAAGGLATAAWLGSAVPRIPVGYMLTRVGRARVIVWSGLLLTVAAAGSAFATSIEWLAAGAFVMGLSSGAYFIAAHPLVSELYPERVGRAIGIQGTVAQLAAVGAAPLVALVLWLGEYRLAFFGLAGGAGIVTGYTWLIARRTELPAAGRADRDLVGAIRAQWRLILTGVALIGLTGLIWNGVFNFYITYLETAKGLSEAAAGTLLTVVFAAGVPAFWLAGDLADRVPKLPLAFAITLGFVVALGALVLVEGVLALFLVSAIIGLLVHGLFPTVNTFMLSTLPDGNRASAYSVYSGVVMLVGSVGSLIVGSLTEIGIAYDTLFGGFALSLGAVILALALAYRAGRLPGA